MPPLTPAAQKAAEAAAAKATAELKYACTATIRTIQLAFSPSLTNGELAQGLGAGTMDVGRWVSTSPRSRNSVPDRFYRAVLERIVTGSVFVAVSPPPADGERRTVVICEPVEVARMATSWTVRNLAGKTVHGAGEDLEDAAAWDLFADSPAPTPAPARPKTTRPKTVEVASERPVAIPAAGQVRELGPFHVYPVGLGCMRLSTVDRPTTAEAQAVFHAALDAGVNFFDTADAYCLDDSEAHHGERLLRDVIGRDGVVVATKCGLIRPRGRWLPNGNPEHLRAACEGSLKALGVDTLDLLQLHAVDPRVPIEDSMGTLAALKEEGKVRHVGVCNVDAAQLDRALAVAPVEVVQLRLSPFDRASAAAGMLGRCRELGLGVIAHSPAGGYRKRTRTADHAALAEIAEKAGSDPHTVAVAWTLALGPHVVTIPGATRIESVAHSAKAAQLAMSGAQVHTLDAAFAHGAMRVPQVPRVRIVMGPPAAGKTSTVAPLADQGWERLNRDDHGGSLDGLLPKLDALLKRGASVVMDNTYPTRTNRLGVVQTASSHKAEVELVLLETAKRDAELNAAKRIVERHGRNLSPAEIAAEASTTPNCFPPIALDTWFTRYQEPELSEGFARITRVPFHRHWDAGEDRALFLDLDGTVRETHGGPPFPRNAKEVHLMKGRREVLRGYVADGWKLFGVSNQAGVALGQVGIAGVQEAADRTAELLDLPIHIAFCPHSHRGRVCWCRKPLPGMALPFLLKHRLDPKNCIMVGDRDSDRAFAEGLSMPYQDQADFFK